MSCLVLKEHEAADHSLLGVVSAMPCPEWVLQIMLFADHRKQPYSSKAVACMTSFQATDSITGMAFSTRNGTRHPNHWALRQKFVVLMCRAQRSASFSGLPLAPLTAVAAILGRSRLLLKYHCLQNPNSSLKT